VAVSRGYQPDYRGSGTVVAAAIVCPSDDVAWNNLGFTASLTANAAYLCGIAPA